MTDEVEPRKKRIAVQVIAQEGESALIEWDGKRGYVPVGAIKDGTVSPTALSKAVPYGVPWERLDEALAADLRKAGIWTRQDLAQNARFSLGIAQGHGLNLGDLNRFATKEG